MAKKPFEAGGIAESNTFVDATDTTKKLTIDVNGTTGVTGTLATAFTTARTITFPDTSGTVALTSDAPVASPTIEGKLYGYSNSTNLSRTTLGYQAGNVATGNGGVLVGYQAGSSVSSGADNTVIGSFAGKGITTGASNTIIGSVAMNSGNGSSNTVIGQYSGTGIGSNNTLVGTGILAPGSGVSNWIAIGDRIAGNTLSASGAHNVVIGQLGLYVATSGAQKSTLGNSAGQYITTASNNVLLGYQAGASGTNNLTTGSNNILLGYQATASSATVSNEITIGNSSSTVFRIPGLSISATTTALTVPSLTPTNAIGAIYGGTGLTTYTTGDILYSSATNTLAKLAAGSNGQILTLAAGVPTWAAAPITLPSQTGNSGKYLTTDGTSASWGTLVVPITTGTATVSANTATTVDTTALSAFTSIEYMISLKQGTKIRTSKVVVQNDGTSVDMTEFAITETGGTIAGVVISATTVSTNGVLQLTVTDAATTNVTVKFSKIAL